MVLVERKACDHVANAYLSIQTENFQNVQKLHFWQKALGVNGLKTLFSLKKQLNLDFTRAHDHRDTHL